MDEAQNPKRAKDLLYLRDLLAAGAGVVGRIEEELRVIAGSGQRGAATLDNATSQIGLTLGRDLRGGLRDVAGMLAEREPELSPEAALADVEGHLTDLRELLDEASGAV